jgi:hypothetical protein
MSLLFLPNNSSVQSTTAAMTILEIQGEPAFKGSYFTAQEYRDAWGDDWDSVFSAEQHPSDDDPD